MTVRGAEPADLPLLFAIEASADTLLTEYFDDPPDWPPPATGDERAGQPGFLLVAGRPPVGFAHVLFLDGYAHLEQLAVQRDAMRRGVGTALLEAACADAAARGFDEISLCTFADVAWNAPFYTRHGFVEVIDLLPYQKRLRETERRVGLDALGRRAVMTRTL